MHLYIRASAVIFLLFAGAAAGSAFGPRTEAAPSQTPPGLEQQKERLISLFELGNVVFTDADERTGRLVVGISDAGAAPAVLQRLPALSVASQSVDIVVTEPIYPMVGLRDQVRPLAGAARRSTFRATCARSASTPCATASRVS
jgi:hypothetical protein